jgi:FSR family fosmidomycin resistance protein-like MFS transporter
MPPLFKSAAARQDARVIGLVGFAHGTSHFFHLLLIPLFPWLMHDFGLSFTEVGALMSIFFVISGIGQAAAGFAVDRFGPSRVLMFGVACLASAGFVLAFAGHYAMLALSAALAGLGNSVFHPVDFTILNRRVSTERLGHAFSVHGLSGNLGWAAAPVFMAGIAGWWSWHAAGFAAGMVAIIVLAVLIWQRDLLHVAVLQPHAERIGHAGPQPGAFAFLASPGVWLCFAFFLVTTLALGGLQNFAPALLNKMYGLSLVTATSGLTAYMLGGAAGIIAGGFLASRNGAHDRVIVMALTVSTVCALVLALGVIPAWSVLGVMAVLGFGVGLAGPSRDLLVRHAATAGFGKAAFGRVYGFVYSGLDLGFAVSPLVFGPLMDHGRYAAVLGGVALLQGLAILTAMGVGSRSRFMRRAAVGAS